MDFVCIRERLIIEADGAQHDASESDQRRTEWLERAGWRVLRFWNNDILANTEGVIETIVAVLRTREPSPASLPLGTLSRKR